jgi:hypothetical protein
MSFIPDDPPSRVVFVILGVPLVPQKPPPPESHYSIYTVFII